MSVLSKPDLKTNKDALFADNTSGDISAADARTVFENIIDSYENLIAEMDTAARDALSPSAGYKIFNTDSNRVEVYDGSQWMAAAQPSANTIDASGTPNFPAALRGDRYNISADGKIGGAAGATIYSGDSIECIEATVAGDYATVGSKWMIHYNNKDATGFSRVTMLTISISNAELKALNGTPKSGGTAPGAGKILMPVYWAFKYHYITSAFTADTAGPIDLYHDGATNPLATICDDLGGLAADNHTIGNKFSSVFDSVAANAVFKIKARNANYDSAGGGRATLQLYYKEHTLP